MTICHYLSLQEARRELLMPSSADLYKWFLDNLLRSGLCGTPSPNCRWISAQPFKSNQGHHPQRAPRCCVSYPDGSGFPSQAGCRARSCKEPGCTKAQVSLFTYLGSMLLQSTDIETCTQLIRGQRRHRGSGTHEIAEDTSIYCSTAGSSRFTGKAGTFIAYH